MDALAHHIGRGAGNRGHDRRVVAGEPVEQARLAGVRPAGDDHRHALAQQPALARTLEHALDRKSTRLNSSHSQISYAVFCLKKKKIARAPILHTHYLSTRLRLT